MCLLAEVALTIPSVLTSLLRICVRPCVCLCPKGLAVTEDPPSLLGGVFISSELLDSCEGVMWLPFAVLLRT